MLRQLPQAPSGRLVVCVLLLSLALPLAAELGKCPRVLPTHASTATRSFGMVIEAYSSVKDEPSGSGMVIEPDGFGMMIEPSGFGMVIEPHGFGMVIEPHGFGMVIEPHGFGMVIEPHGFGMVIEPHGLGAKESRSIWE